MIKRIDPRLAAVTDTYAVRPPRSGGRMPLAASEALLWVGRGGTPAIVGLDPATGSVVVAVHVRIDPYALAAGFGEVWVTDRTRGLVLGLDATDGQQLHRVHVEGATGVAVGETSVWVTSTATDGLVEIDRSSGQVLRSVLTGPTPMQAHLDPGGTLIYVLGRDGLPITAVDVSGSVRQGTVELAALTFAAGAPWGLLPSERVVGRLDPESLELATAMELPDAVADGLAAAGGRVWVADATHLYGIGPAP
jgi:hypothetical protein